MHAVSSSSLIQQRIGRERADDGSCNIRIRQTIAGMAVSLAREGQIFPSSQSCPSKEYLLDRGQQPFRSW
jgi:hypothetical protein